MSAAQAEQERLTGTVAVAIVPPEYTPTPLIEAQKLEQKFLGPLQIPGDIVSNLALNCYITLVDLDYFGHKGFEDFCSARSDRL